MKKIPILPLLVLAGLGLGGCSNVPFLSGGTERAKGPGTGTDDLRISPCACMELPNAAPDDAALGEIRRALGRG